MALVGAHTPPLRTQGELGGALYIMANVNASIVSTIFKGNTATV